jgi:hypothetical protein
MKAVGAVKSTQPSITSEQPQTDDDQDISEAPAEDNTDAAKVNNNNNNNTNDTLGEDHSVANFQDETLGTQPSLQSERDSPSNTDTSAEEPESDYPEFEE